MEEASKAKKAKKGFMTPERKKKLRLLLRKKAAEELKKEQERKAAERRRIIEERCGSPRNLSDASEGMFAQIHFSILLFLSNQFKHFDHLKKKVYKKNSHILPYTHTFHQHLFLRKEKRKDIFFSIAPVFIKKKKKWVLA